MRANWFLGFFQALVLQQTVQLVACQATAGAEYDVVAAGAAATSAAEANMALSFVGVEEEVAAALTAEHAVEDPIFMAAPAAPTTGSEPGATSVLEDSEGWSRQELAVPPGSRSRRLQADFNIRRRRTALSPPTAMVITNLAYVVDTWVIYELQMYLGDCVDKIPVPIYESAIMSTGNSQKFPSARDANAFDNNMATNYTADCSRAQLNCIPEAVYIGLDITSMDEWDDAMDPNATFEEYDALQVKCIRFFQSDLPMNRADIIGVQELYLGGDAEMPNFKDGYTFETLMIFDDVPGGVWVRRPSDRNQLWRVSNMESTEERWTITEIEFFSDIFCKSPLIGGVFSSPSNDPVWGSPLAAFDGNHSSSWRADCQTWDEVAYQYGCRPFEAWIGMDFGEMAVEVRCLRILQRLHDPDAVIAEKPSFSRGISLEYWSGAFGEWKNSEQFWAAGTTIADWGDEDSGPTLPSPFFGIGPGVWEDTRQPRQCAWRLENDEKTKGPWIVHELEFYPDNDCQGQRMSGEAISHMGADYQYNASLAFDRDPLLYYGWQAICTEGYEGSGPGACGKYEAWVGLYFRNQQVNVSCIRLMQAGKVDNIAPGVLLSFWTNTSWEPFYVHRDMGGGTWNRRPAAPWSMWRVYNDRPIETQWQVNEIRAYRDPMCLYPVTRGQSLTNGFLRYNQPPDNAFDGLLSTHWGADCEVCTAKGLHGFWIGDQLPVGAPDPINMDYLVRCIKMWQVFTQENQVDVVKVDVWNGQDWILSPFSIHGVVSGGGGAGWMRAPAAYASKWRLKLADTWNMQWRLKEIEFYADTACSQRLPTPILE